MTPLPTSWTFTLILSSIVYACLRVVTLCFLTKTLCAFLVFSVRATCLTHLSVHDLIRLVIFGEEYETWSYWLCTFLQSFDASVTSTEISPCHKHRDISPSSPLSNNSLCTSRNVTDRVSHPCNTNSRITVFWIKTAQDVIFLIDLLQTVYTKYTKISYKTVPATNFTT